MKTNIVSIPSGMEVAFFEKVKKLQKKAAKMGLPAISLKRLETHNVFNEGDIIPSIETDFALEYEILQFKDWDFLCSIEHTSEGNIIYSVNNVEIPLEYIKNIDSFCDHCQIRRYRKKTYIVRNQITLKIMQVGSSCVKEFIGIDPNRVLAFFETLKDFEDFDKNFLELLLIERIQYKKFLL